MKALLFILVCFIFMRGDVAKFSRILYGYRMQSSVMFLDENCSWDTVNYLFSFPDFLIACNYSTDSQVTRYGNPCPEMSNAKFHSKCRR